MNTVKDAVYFISDAHFGLGKDCDDRVLLFMEFAAKIREHAAALYMVGDMFGFWIEYKHAVRPDYFLVLHTLRNLVCAGVEVHYITGNHDFAVGSFLEDMIGITVHREPVDVVLQGKKVHINHGDRVRNGGAPRLLDKILRNKFFRAAYKIIHPTVGVNLGTRLSLMIKKKSGGRKNFEKDLEMYRQAARQKISAGECDIVIYAHTHHGEFVRFDGGVYLNTGAWMDTHDYAVMRGGEICLMKYAKDFDIIRTI